MTRSTSRSTSWYYLKKSIVEKRVGYLMILPFSIIFFTFTLLPVIVAILYSFTYNNLLQPATWVGFQNYIKLFFDDEIFLIAVKNTLIFAAVTGPVGYFLCFFIAWFVNELTPKLRSVVTLLFYAPALAGTLSIWSTIFSGDRNGYLNSFLLEWGFIDAPFQWFTDPSLMKGCLIVVILWSSLGAGFLSFIAGFQTVDRSLYEAGAIDGIKNRYQELWYITVPSMKGQMLFSAIMSITASFNIGDQITLLCGFPSTNYAAHTIMNHLTDYGSTRYEMGYACAISTVLFLIMVGCNQLIQKLLSKVGQ